MSVYTSRPATPRTSATPNMPTSMGGYTPPPQQQTATRREYPMMSNLYQQPQQFYPASSVMTLQGSVTPAHSQLIALAPLNSGHVPSVLDRMLAGRMMPQSGLASSHMQSPMIMQSSPIQENHRSIRVVGSQGRRGILPSAPGRPAPPAPGSAAAETCIPQKNTDGKFPCPQCPKTYSRAAHLKRHMLRHTGHHPYMCVLCGDTFSRSDTLKRHFQKCSARRGNPTGVSHLSHPAAHVKKNAWKTAAQLGHGHEGDIGHLNGMDNTHNPSMVPFGLIPAYQMHMPSNPNNQAQNLSWSSSHFETRRSGSTPILNASSQQHYNGVPTSIGQQMPPPFTMAL